MHSDKQLFLTQNCFSQELLQPNFSMGCIIGEIATDQESDRQNSLHEDLNEILSEEKLKEGLTDPLETSADPRMIAIVDESKIQKRKAYRIPQNTRKNTSWAVRVWFEMGGGMQRFDPNHWIR